MDSRTYNEVDLRDLLMDWISHWKSLFAILALGVLAVTANYLYICNKYASNSTDTTSLIAYTDEDFETILSQEELNYVDGLVELENSYNENLNMYNEEEKKLELVDKADIMAKLVYSSSTIHSMTKTLSDDQKQYYDYLHGAEIYAPVQPGFSHRNAMIKSVFVLIALCCIHFLIFGFRYLISDYIKPSDSLTLKFGIPEFTRVIDWEKNDSLRGIDNAIIKYRFRKTRRTTLEDTLKINASAIIEKGKKNGSKEIVVVGMRSEKERNMLRTHILSENESIDVKSIDSVTHCVESVDDIVGVDSAVLVVKIGYSTYKECIEELDSLKIRGIDVLGIVAFE